VGGSGCSRSTRLPPPERLEDRLRVNIVDGSTGRPLGETSTETMRIQIAWYPVNQLFLAPYYLSYI